MNIIISKEEENPLIKRREIVADLTYDKATPSREEIKKALSEKVGSQDIVIVSIENQYGFQKAKVKANVYKDAQSLKRFEPQHLQKRGAKKAGKDEAAAEKVDDKTEKKAEG